MYSYSGLQTPRYVIFSGQSYVFLPFDLTLGLNTISHHYFAGPRVTLLTLLGLLPRGSLLVAQNIVVANSRTLSKLEMRWPAFVTLNPQDIACSLTGLSNHGGENGSKHSTGSSPHP